MGVVAIVALSVWFADLRREAEWRYFSAVLKESGADETVAFDGTRYRVTDGEVYAGNAPYVGPKTLGALRLAYAKTLARRNPLFPLPGSDIAALTQSVQDLRRVESDYAASQKNGGDRSALSALYPLRFISAATVLESTRRSFLETGDAKTQVAYELALAKTFDTYRADVAAFEAAFARSVTSQAKAYATEAVIINRDSVLALFDTLQKKSVQLGEEERNRELCVRGLLRACDVSALSFFPLPAARDPALSPELLSAARDTEALYAEVRNNPLLARAQIFVLARSECTARTPALFALERDSASGDSRVLYLNDVQLVESARYGTDPYYRYFADRGVRYVLHDFYSQYKCFGIGSDWGVLAAMRSMQAFAAASALSPYIPSDERWEFRRLTSSLAPERPYITDSDAIRYLMLAQRVVLRPGVPSSIRDTIASLSLEFGRRNAGFDTSTQKITRYEQYLLGIRGKGVPLEIPASYLFFVRSGFYFFFMADSLLGSAAEQFPANEIPAAEQPYVWYSELPRTSQMRAEMIRGLRVFGNLHQLTSDVE